MSALVDCPDHGRCGHARHDPALPAMQACVRNAAASEKQTAADPEWSIAPPALERRSSDHDMALGATDVAKWHSGALGDGGAGSCLATTAILAKFLTDHDIPVMAVRGSFEGEAHWWLETDDHIFDATRGQFDDGDVMSPKDAPQYAAEERFEPKWTAAQVIQECEAAFVEPEVAHAYAAGLQEELRELS